MENNDVRPEERFLLGNYAKRQNISKEIQRKLRTGEALATEEILITCRIMEDPLEEFCLREGTFRLIEIMGLNTERANELEYEAAEAIRDIIDNSQDLYDDIDETLHYDVIGDWVDEDEQEGRA